MHTSTAPTMPARSVDWGRVGMVPLATVLGAAAVSRVVTLTGNDAAGALALASTAVSAALTALFYTLMVWAYLRRGPARATSSVRLVLLAAPVATFLPFALPHVGAGGASTDVVVLADLLLAGGLIWSVWSLRHLDRSLSVVPQARVLVVDGPYRLVRHPLYLGEIVAMLGLALSLGGVWPVVGWSVLVALQCYRATQEESLLGAHLPGYAAYRARTARVLPGLF